MSRTYEQLAPVISALDERIKTNLGAFPTDTAEGSIASFADGADGIPLKSLVVNIDPVQSGSGDPSPDNVRPISGWTGMTVNASGKNLYSGEDINLTWSTLMPDMLTAIKEIPVGSQFTISFDVELLSKESTFSSESQYGIAFIGYKPPNRNKWLNWNASDAIGTVHHFDTTLVAQDGLEFVYCYGCGSNANGATGRARIFNIQLELGSTATDYEPYSGQTIPIDWQTEAGTVYGGHLDVLTGVLTVYPYYASYNGETLTGRWISDRDVYAVGTTPTIGAQVVNIGAEGTEIQLSPTEVKSLLGQNNIFADTGDSAVEYRADTKLYIERLTEPDADMIADANITSGSYFMVGNTLYKATANIASGSAVIEGTNATRKSLSEALNEINQ